MAYIGIGNRQDYIADFQAQNFSGDGSTTAFTLNYEAVTGSIRVAVDNVLQPADGSSYTVNGFTLNFTAAPASGTNNITVLFLGTVRNVSSVSDGAIVTAKIADSAIVTAKIADGAVTEAKLASGVNTITVLDKFVLTSTKTGTGDLTANLARESSNNYGGIGSTMTESSGIFTFPSTGIYLITFQGVIAMSSANSRYNELRINTSIDSGSNYNIASNTNGSIPTGYSSNAGVLNAFCLAVFDVTNTSTHQVKFSTNLESASAQLISSFNNTSMTFIRLGDT